MAMWRILKLVALALGLSGLGLVAAPVPAAVETERRGTVEECVLARTAIRQPFVAARTVSPHPVLALPAEACRRSLDHRPAIALDEPATSHSPRSPPLL